LEYVCLLVLSWLWHRVLSSGWLQNEASRQRREILHILAVSPKSYSQITSELAADLTKTTGSIDQVHSCPPPPDMTITTLDEIL